MIYKYLFVCLFLNAIKKTLTIGRKTFFKTSYTSIVYFARIINEGTNLEL